MDQNIITRPYEYDIQWTGAEIIENYEFTTNILGRIKECENQVQNQFEEPSKKQLALKIAGLVIISLAAIAAIFAAVAFATTLLPFTAILIIGGGSAVALIAGIVLAVLGFKKQNEFEEYLDNCPYYQGLTQMLNGDYVQAAQEFQKYTLETDELDKNNEKVKKLDKKVFNDLNAGKKLTEKGDAYEITSLYFIATHLLGLRSLEITILKQSKDNLKVVDKREEEKLKETDLNLKKFYTYNRFKPNVNLPDFEAYENVIKILMNKLCNNVGPTPEQIKDYHNLSIPSLKTSPNLFTITKR